MRITGVGPAGGAGAVAATSAVVAGSPALALLLGIAALTTPPDGAEFELCGKSNPPRCGKFRGGNAAGAGITGAGCTTGAETAGAGSTGATVAGGVE